MSSIYRQCLEKAESELTNIKSGCQGIPDREDIIFLHIIHFTTMESEPLKGKMNLKFLGDRTKTLNLLDILTHQSVSTSLMWEIRKSDPPRQSKEEICNMFSFTLPV